MGRHTPPSWVVCPRNADEVEAALVWLDREIARLTRQIVVWALVALGSIIAMIVWVWLDI